MSKKKLEEKRKKERSRRLLYVGICAVVFISIVGVLFFAWFTQVSQNNGKLWAINAAGKLSFTDRGTVEASAQQVEGGANDTLEKVVYKSFGDDVYALLRKPKNVTKPPVIIILPAATITKEADHPMAEALADMGYASLTLDARGNGGQTGGDFAGNWNSGLSAYVNGGDPVQYKQVYDVLKGFDYVKSRADLDGNDVAVMGESIGGMWAVIAAGEEPQLKGVVTISGFDLDNSITDNQTVLDFRNAVTPSMYLGNLPPRKLAMFQFDADPIVTMDQGKALYNKAHEPKGWHLYNGTIHGLYDNAYAPDLQNELKGMLGR